MKKIILFSLLILLFTEVKAHKNLTDANVIDTLLTAKDVVVVSKKEKRTSMVKLNVPDKYLPISTSVLDAKNTEMRGIQDIEEAVRFIPGVRMQTGYGSFQTLYVRGFNQAPIMMDGIRDERSMINSSAFPDLSAVESIELLKGPASVMYGHSVVGGILNVVRKAPSAENSLNSRVSYGSFNDKRATVGMGGRLVGPVNYYSSINFRDQDGWRDNGNKKFSGYLALGAKLSDKDNLDIRASFNDNFYGTDIGLPDLMPADVYNDNGNLYLKKGAMLPGLNKEARYNNESDFFKHKSWNVSGTYTHTFNENLKLENKTSYMYDDMDYFGTESLSYLESDNPIYDHYYMDGNQKKYICLDSVELDSPLRFAHIAQTIGTQMELIGKISTGKIVHNYMAGYSFSVMLRDSYTGYDLGTDVQGPGLFSHVSVKNPQSMGYMTTKFSKAYVTQSYTHSVYLQDMIELSEKWKVLVAGRYDYFKYKSASTTTTGKREYNKSELPDFNSIVNSSFSYRAGLVYLPNRSVSVYASMSSFFKPIRTFYNPLTIYVDKNGDVFTPTENEQVFKPESGYQVEMGAKYTFNTLLSVNASLFYIRRQNTTQKLGTMPVEENGAMVDKTIRGQVGVVDSKGFDVEFTFTPLKTLFFTAGYSYTDARIRDIATVKDPKLLPYVNDGLDSNSGNFQTNVPRSTIYGMADYTIPNGVLKNLGFLLSANYMDKIYRNTANTTYYDPYWQADMGVFYSLPNNVRLSLNVNNIFNKQFYNQSVGDQMIPSMPRNFQVSISYKI